MTCAPGDGYQDRRDAERQDDSSSGGPAVRVRATASPEDRRDAVRGAKRTRAETGDATMEEPRSTASCVVAVPRILSPVQEKGMKGGSWSSIMRDRKHARGDRMRHGEERSSSQMWGAWRRSDCGTPKSVAETEFSPDGRGVLCFFGARPFNGAGESTKENIGIASGGVFFFGEGGNVAGGERRPWTK